jgi:hypothetical protein
MEEKLISDFNEAKFQVFRLHNLWNQARQQRESGNFDALRWTLDTAEIELTEDAKLLDQEKDNKFIQDLENLNSSIIEAWKKRIPALYYKELMKKEKLLREILELSGKGAKRRSQDEDGMQ